MECNRGPIKPRPFKSKVALHIVDVRIPGQWREGGWGRDGVSDGNNPRVYFFQYEKKSDAKGFHRNLCGAERDLLATWDGWPYL